MHRHPTSSSLFILTLCLTLGLLHGCATPGVVEQLTRGTLRSEVDDCAALPPMSGATLEGLLSQLRDPLEAGKTGVHVLEDGAGALMARAWLTERAQKSIDIQYFIFSSDNLGLLAAEALLRAAQRGVKVRMLVDDLLHDGDADFLRVLDGHPNLEIRIYNPNINIGKSLPGKLLTAARDFRGINQRMHNKTFIVDSEVVITGGRNIADEYFDFSPTYNFRDRDLLLIGGVTDRVEASFSQFWAHELAVPLGELLPGEAAENQEVWAQLKRYACRPENYWPEVRRRIARVPERFAELQAEGALRWVEGVRFISDAPGKNDGRSGMKGGGVTTDALMELVAGAQREVIIQTPYLVTTERGRTLFREAVERGVRVRILTNSLSSTDNFAAFSGYARDRKVLLATGVQVYEFKSDAPIAAERMTSARLLKRQQLPRFGVHAKSMVIDGELLVVGTFNLDPRSANLNTECVVVIRDGRLASEVLKLLEEEVSEENAWRVTPEQNPDSEAPLGHRWKLFWARPVPKSIL